MINRLHFDVKNYPFLKNITQFRVSLKFYQIYLMLNFLSNSFQLFQLSTELRHIYNTAPIVQITAI